MVIKSATGEIGSHRRWYRDRRGEKPTRAVMCQTTSGQANLLQVYRELVQPDPPALSPGYRASMTYEADKETAVTET